LSLAACLSTCLRAIKMVPRSVEFRRPQIFGQVNCFGFGENGHLTRALLAAALVAPAVAFASLPAMDEDILCGSTDIVVGTVLKATRSEPPRVDAFCGYKPWNCTPGYTSSCQENPHQITLKIRVSDVLGTTANLTLESSPFYTRAEQVKVSVGDTVEVTTELFNNVCKPRN
jgi:hypothetical protein